MTNTTDTILAPAASHESVGCGFTGLTASFTA